MHDHGHHGPQLVHERPPEPAKGRRGVSPAFERLVRAYDWSGKRALDVGCGTGGASVLLASLGARAVGMDVDPQAVRMAKRRVKEDGVTGARFVVGDAERADYRKLAKGPLDGVVAHLCFSDKITRRASAGLAPGGAFLVRCFHQDMWKEIGQGQHFAYSLPKFRALLKAAGLVPTHVEVERRKQRFGSFADFEASFFNVPGRREQWVEDGRYRRVERHFARGGRQLSEAFIVAAATKPSKGRRN